MAPVAAAVLPHPPLLVPELAGAAAPELAPLRAACQEALSIVVGAADLTILVGDGPVWAIPAPAAPGSFQPYGADVDVTLPTLADLDLPGLPPPARLTDLPLSLAVAAQLLADLDLPPARLFAATVPRSLGPRAAATIGQTLAGAARFGLVVMADLSACRTEGAPGGFRPEAADFDAWVADAFRTGTPQSLLAIDPTDSTTLLVSGRVPLQVLAGAFDRGRSVVGADPGEGRAATREAGAGEDGPPSRGTSPDEVTPAAHDEPLDQPGSVMPDRPGSVVPDTPGSVMPDRPGSVVPDQPGSATPDRGSAASDATGPELRGRVLYEDAPYGVGYLVALLTAP
jgi:hypothetical protein